MAVSFGGSVPAVFNGVAVRSFGCGVLLVSARANLLVIG
jgi:hypothetical protein